MDDVIKLAFRYSEHEYAKALRSHYADRLRPRLDFIVAAFCMVVGVYTWRDSELHWLSMFCIAASCVVMGILIVAFLVIPPLAFRREPKFRDEYSLTFSDEGIHFVTQHIDSRLKWNLYSRALINRHSYVLYYGKHQFTVIPARVFADSIQQGAFERLLTANVANVKRYT